MPHAEPSANSESVYSRWVQVSVPPAGDSVWTLRHPLLCAMKAMNELK